MLQITTQKPKEALNPALRKQKLAKAKMDTFKRQLSVLLEKNTSSESEEHQKIILIDFLKKVYYDKQNEVNTKERVDLVIYDGKTSKSDISVLIETKKASNKSEMFSSENLNVKSFHQLVLYFLREFVDENNTSLKNLIVTDFVSWYIFDAQDFKKVFDDKKLIKKYQDWSQNKSVSSKTDDFYKKIASPFIEKVDTELVCTAFDFSDYADILQKTDNEEDKKLISLYKFLSPDHLLKEFKFDNNQLNRGFYNELLHIMGLEEVKQKGKKIIQRKTKNQHKGSLMESAIHAIQNSGRSSGGSETELFESSLELCITWINRVLFLKLLESQLITFHKGNVDYQFLNQKTIPNFDELHVLFFDVLAKMTHERNAEVNQKYAHVPYLNSSLFDQTELEKKYINIRELDDNQYMPYFSQTELRDGKGKKQTGNAKPLTYLFDFLGAYDFSAEGTEEIQEHDKQLISASVLGLVFEKINGYKDGSFFTPSFITMYMSRETLRKAVIQKFNDKYGWDAENFDDLELSNKKRDEYNDLINSIKICDPAVGSGHFLVSCLNELIAIKSELGILQDKDGKRLRYIQMLVENDELLVMDEDEIFEYTVSHKNGKRTASPEKQNIQETIFREKKHMIENCLYGVDLNPKAVHICRLRLWIELLKHTHYKVDTDFQELEILPNLDMKILQGNSLVPTLENQPFSIDWEKGKLQAIESTKKHIEKINQSVEIIRQNTKELFNINQAETKYKVIRKIEDAKIQIAMAYCSIEQIKIQNTLALFDPKTRVDGKLTDKEVQQKQALELKSKQLKDKHFEMQVALYYKQSISIFDWKIMFSDVLGTFKNGNGNGHGFDVIIGNPPYIRHEEIKEIKPFLQGNYQVYSGTADILIYFIEKAIKILKPNGYSNFIIANKFMRSGFGKPLRAWLKKYQIQEIIDFGDLPIFEEATTYPLILSVKNTEKPMPFEALNVENLKESETIFTKNRFQIEPKYLKDDGWVLAKPEISDLMQKIKNQGIPLGEYVNNQIFYGIKTGFNEAFVIDENTKNQLIAEDKKSAGIIKPFLAGRDIKRYQNPKTEKYLILFRNGDTKKWFGKLEETQAWKKLEKKYPAICKHLINYELQAKKRYDKGNYWWELRACDYYEEFEKPKIMLPDIAIRCEALIDYNNNYCVNTAYVIPNLTLSDLGILNSKLILFFYSNLTQTIRGGYLRFIRQYLEQIPFIKTNILDEKVEEILRLKKENSGADTSILEGEIDKLVYELYGLTDEEIAIVEGK